MKKLFAWMMVLALCVGVLSGCGNTPTATPTPADQPTATPAGDDDLETPSILPESTQLNLYTWEGMFPQEVLDAFEEEFGITVVYDNFDDGETMLTKLQTVNGGDYDLIIVDDYILEKVFAQGLAQKLDKSKLAYYGNINPAYQGHYYDPQDEYTVPYGCGVQTIVYDPMLVDLDIKGYADLWDESLKGKVGTIGNFRVINGMALKVMGESYNTEDVEVITAAGEKLKELAPNIRLIRDDSLENELISGEISVAVMYTSQVTMAKQANPDLKVVYPSEGIGFGIMAQFIPSNAPHADAAYKFIDYILRPEVSKACFEYLGYYCTNKAADALIDPSMKDLLTLPEDFDLDKVEMIESLSPELEELHLQIWNEFKSGLE